MKCKTAVSNAKAFKIFEGGTVREMLAKLLKEGYRPATVKEIYDLKQQDKIPIQWYNTRTCYYQGEIRTATMKELKNIDAMYKKGLHLLFAGNDYYGGLIGGDDLDYGRRFVGVKIVKKARR